MYADKKLGGVNAVQTLSRVNRTHPAGRGQSSLSAELFPGLDVRNNKIVYQGESVTTNKKFSWIAGQATGACDSNLTRGGACQGSETSGSLTKSIAGRP
jgi:hypothetical protein